MKHWKKWMAALGMAACVAGMSLGLSLVSDGVLASQLSPTPAAETTPASPTPVAEVIPASPTPPVFPAENPSIQGDAWLSGGYGCVPVSGKLQPVQAMLSPTPQPAAESQLGQEILAALTAAQPTPQRQMDYLLTHELRLAHINEMGAAETLVYQESLDGASRSGVSLVPGQLWVSQEQFGALRGHLAAAFQAASGISLPESGYVCQISLNDESGTWRAVWRPVDYALAEMAERRGVPTYDFQMDRREMVGWTVTVNGTDLGEALEKTILSNVGWGDRLGDGELSIKDLYFMDTGSLVCTVQDLAEGGETRMAQLPYSVPDAQALQDCVDAAAGALLSCLPPENVDALRPLFYPEEEEATVPAGLPELLGSLTATDHQVQGIRLLQPLLQLNQTILYRADLARAGECSGTAEEMEEITALAAELFESLLGMNPRGPGYVAQVDVNTDGQSLYVYFDAVDWGLRAEKPTEYKLTLDLSRDECSAQMASFSLPLRQLEGHLLSVGETDALAERLSVPAEELALRRMETSGGGLLTLTAAPRTDKLDTSGNRQEYTGYWPGYDEARYQAARAAVEDWLREMLAR